jgi:ComF family protein
VYRDTLRWLIHSLKYDGMEPVAHQLGSRLTQALLTLEPGAPRTMQVVPVPLHPAKQKLRGFNHAELLARSAVKAVRKLQRAQDKAPWDLRMTPGILERQRATQSQAGLSPHQRRENLRGAFFVPRPDRIKGSRILLIDDIYTTGATARACTKALLAARAEAVWVATLARAQRETIQAPEFGAETGPEQERPMREDVAFWDSSFGRPAEPLDH